MRPDPRWRLTPEQKADVCFVAAGIVRKMKDAGEIEADDEQIVQAFNTRFKKDLTNDYGNGKTNRNRTDQR